MYKNWEKKLTKHKSLETELRTNKDTSDGFNFDIGFTWTTKSDQAGMNFRFTFFRKIDFQVSLRDHRHWNETLDTWHTDASWEQEVKKMCDLD